MNQFLDLSFTNHLRNHDELREPYENCFNPMVEKLKKLFSKEKCDEFTEVLFDCANEALHVAGVMGMELAIGVMNGTIKQCIE